MPKRLHRKGSPVRGIAGVFDHQTKAALAALSRTRFTDRGVHDARKRLKEARASLRLLRKDLGKTTYRWANLKLRDAARPFAEVRDAKVLRERFDGLASQLEKHRDVVRAVTSYLADERKRARRMTLAERARRVSKENVQRARKKTLSAGKKSGGWPVAAAGLRRVYGSAREALREARLRPSVETLHEWRKQVKYLRHALEILLPRGAARSTTRSRARPSKAHRRDARVRKGGVLGHRAHRLTDLLGEDHDLALLGARLVTGRMAGHVHERAVRLIEPRIVARRTALQRRAFSLGKEFFARRPAAFEKDVHAQMRRWPPGDRPR